MRGILMKYLNQFIVRLYQNIQKSLRKGLCWIIDSVANHTVNISKNNPSSGGSYIKLPKEYDHPKKNIINIWNVNDNECFKYSLVRYSHAADHHPARIREVDWWFEDDVKFLKIKLPVKIRDIHKIEKRNSIATSAFHHENKKYPIYVPKKIFEEKHVDLSLIEKYKRHYVLINDFNTVIYDHTLHCGKNVSDSIFYRLSVQTKFQKIRPMNALKLKVNKWLRSLKGEYIGFQNYERKIELPFLIYADFESILVPKEKGWQNSDESYTNKYQKHVACSYGYKLVCVNDKFCKPFLSHT